jgi:hypothetical protein
MTAMLDYFSLAEERDKIGDTGGANDEIWGIKAFAHNLYPPSAGCSRSYQKALSKIPFLYNPLRQSSQMILFPSQ